jgi:hypothetical protein
MSLNFVASATLNTDASGAQTEELIVSSEASHVRANARSEGAGLFDQLRLQQEEKERLNDEKRAAGLGVATLNDEDVEHVNRYVEGRDKRRRDREAEERAELELFNEEKKMRREGMVVADAEEKEEGGEEEEEKEREAERPRPVAIIARKKGEKTKKVAKKEERAKAPAPKPPAPAKGLGELLADYGSDSD